MDGTTWLMFVELDSERDALLACRHLRECGALDATPYAGTGCIALFEAPAADALSARLEGDGRSARAWRRAALCRVTDLPASEPPGRTVDAVDPGVVERCRHVLDVAHEGQVLVSASLDAARGWCVPGRQVHDLGVHRLRDLGPPVRLLSITDEAAEDHVPVVPSLSTLPNNLPVLLTSFIGRRHEQSVLAELVRRHHILTLVGQGGAGKTRLAMHVGAGLIDRWPDGVWLADLGGADARTSVARAVADALDIPINEKKEPLETLTTKLESAELLLVLDTCEPVLREARALAERLVETCPGVRLLCTSREPLGAGGEVVWAIPPLDTHDAATLFVHRAELAHPGIASELDADQIRELCIRLDSLPLAIELAAAWARTLSPQGILRGLDERFRLLTGGPPWSTDRHHAMRTSIDWSYDLLSPHEQFLFRRLSVFRSSFSVEAAAAICTDSPAGITETLQAVRRLSDKSLLSTMDDQWPTRYRLLDTLREYGAERMTEEERVQVLNRHLAWFCEHAETCEQRLAQDQDQWVRALDQERDDLHAAVDWGLASGLAEPTRRLAAALSLYWCLTGQSGRAVPILTRALELSDDDRDGLDARLWAGIAMAGLFSRRRTVGSDAAKRGEQVALTSGDEVGRARCLAVRAYELFYVDFAECERLSRVAVDAGLTAADGFARRLGWLLVACSLTNRDLHERARTVAVELAVDADLHNDRFAGSFAQAVQQWAALFQGDVTRAVAFAREALRRCRPLRDYFTIGTNTGNLAWSLGLNGQVEDGVALMSSVVRSLDEGGPDADAVSAEVIMGKLLWWAGDYPLARDWLRRSLEFDKSSYANWIAARTLAPLSAVLRELGDVDEAHAMAMAGVDVGRALEIPHAVADALDQLAVLVLERDPVRALEHTVDALKLRVQFRLRTFYVDSFRLLAENPAYGEPFEMTRLAAAATHASIAMGYLARSPGDRARDNAVHEQLKTDLGAAAFGEAWREGTAMGIDDAAAYVLRAYAPRARRASTGWDSLTPMERQVAVLVARGLTNPEVAQRLYVSRTTVKTHLGHIFTKLDISNRTQLAQLVIQSGHMPE
ncbi:LuxR C-terminal-related transcriptional regulator [Phytoactinopolyspora halotolerans]|uniref:HTH luxR-type domain-containing protein n=1 Tax=Phytoactinopolyspora halotolerans TaxID=1981512 RepID=A0A6L9SIV0_9ACTN|nr:LuxR C-terminal-related transcriptional regulator [Phytoactinopolyspora halotolerans]NEE04211.1 hypothetical protein [Phytoactinopolyspora halotolerans]